MVSLHEKAKTSLKDEILTKELLNERDENGDTVLHVAAEHNTINTIPKHLLTCNALKEKNSQVDTVWHIIAFKNNFKDIPENLLTTEDLNTQHHIY